MPWERPDGRRHPVFEGAMLQGRQQRIDVGDEDVGRAGELHGEAGVEHVGARHALVDEARLRPHDLAEMRQERDDVVLRLPLDGIDPPDVEWRRPRPLAQMVSAADFGMTPEVRQRVAGMRLDLEPDAEPGLRVPRWPPWRGGE